MSQENAIPVSDVAMYIQKNMMELDRIIVAGEHLLSVLKNIQGGYSEEMASLIKGETDAREQPNPDADDTDSRGGVGTSA
jgi:hypothetical protein